MLITNVSMYTEDLLGVYSRLQLSESRGNAPTPEGKSFKVVSF